MKVSNSLAMRQARRFNQQGLTLIELLVVLMILIALAGILIPQLPNMLLRAHAASGATSIKETNKAIQHFEQLYFKTPSGFDNLATTAAVLPDYLPTDGGGVAGGSITAGALNAGEIAALVAAGITEVAQLQPTTVLLAGESPTFNPYDAGSIATPGYAAIAAEAVVETLVRSDIGVGDRYVIFGIGNRSEMLGKSMSDAGSDFIDGATGNAGDSYRRFGAIYKIANDTVALDTAVFVGTVAIHDDGLVTPGMESAEFYNAIQE